MLTCNEVSHDIASDALDGAPWRRRMAVRLHLVMCDRCRRFAKELRALGDAARRVASITESSPADAALERRLLTRLADAISAEEKHA
jgi:hypothetical protein